MVERDVTAARRLLLRMVEPGRGTPGTRRPLTRTELGEWADSTVATVVDQFARARLLTTDEDGAQIAHEALLTCWPRLADWLEEDRDRLRHHRRLTEAAHAWLEAHRDPGALYRGTRLDRAEELFAQDSALTAVERGFLTAALEARDAERRTAARAARRSRILLGSLASVLVVALVSGLVAWTQARAGDRQRTDTAARRVADVADSLRTTDPRTAMLLGAAAWDISPLPESRRALLGALAQPELDAFTGPLPTDRASGFLTDSGRTLLGADGRAWRTWDVATHRRTGSGPLPSGAKVLAVGPDAKVLALSTSQGVRLWDTRRGRWTGFSRPLPGDSTGIAFGAGGHSYVTKDWNGDTSGRARDLDLVRGGGIRALAFTADGSRLAAGDYTGRVALWDGDLRRRAGILRDVFPDSRTDTPEAVSVLALSPDGRTLAVGGDAGTLQLWDTTTQQPLGVPLPTQGEAIGSLAFSADSRTLYTSSAHAPLRRYDIDPAQAIRSVCARAGTSLTRAQWQTYAPDTEYRKVCGHRP
ncbi:WD40 repeat domain-containing protein [Streptomyces phyllanthi]|uniref:WD40 repeat domain-containing protein n=1 Tax=Streptomyces phyllanthi TaxID=1803180 RepID=A0A5N8W5P8_9ACTN|nr:WD40 repeat domain-containing protein [Streptomyces phyllanthi]MPY41668.1 WD40 repeat domain-containing protein [Streptomyces phyllanthi]